MYNAAPSYNDSPVMISIDFLCYSMANNNNNLLLLNTEMLVFWWKERKSTKMIKLASPMKHPWVMMLPLWHSATSSSCHAQSSKGPFLPTHLAPKGLVAQVVEHHTGDVSVWVRSPLKS